MKNKFLLTLLFVVALGYTSMAQSITIGPRVGVNFATMRAVGGDEKEDRKDMNDHAKSITGTQFGVVANFGINEMFSIQPELLYSQKGLKAEESDYDMSLKIEHKKNYLEIPVLAKLSFGSEDFQGFVTAGPYLGYWMSGKVKAEFMGRKIEDDYEFTKNYDEDDYKENRLDLGASIGIGAAYRVGPGSLNLDVRYGYGFSDDTKYKDGRPDGAFKSSNRVIGVSLAYLFSL